MMATLKAEFRKLSTVRSTYITTAIALLFIAFMTFYVEGMRGSAEAFASPDYLSRMVLNAPGVVAQLGLIVAAMLIIHEYRYNTINYTLTASNSRTRVFLSKIIVITVYSLIFTLIGLGLGILCVYAGAAVADKTIAPQNFDVANMLARCVFYATSFMLFGFFLATVLRNIAVTILIMFMAPATVEPLLGLLLKENAVYLPFAVLSAQVAPPGQPLLTGGGTYMGPAKAAVIFAVYLATTAAISWWLFLRRDAN